MKQRVHFLSFSALFLCVMLLLTSLARNAEGTFQALLADTKANEMPVIILDAGHGGEDGGAGGVNGITEKELNLSLTRMLADQLRCAGFTVIETRTEDKLLYDEGTKKGHKKQGDLTNRLAFMKQYPNSVFISIHMNTFPNGSCRGTQVWYSQNDERSAALADAVQTRVRSVLQPENNRRIKAATSSIYLLRHASVPAILVECGFLTTPDECELLSSPSYQRKLALTLAGAICENLSIGSCESKPSVL